MALNKVGLTASIPMALLLVGPSGCARETPAPSTAAGPTTQASDAREAVAPRAPGLPVPGTRLTDAYVREVGRSAYFWAWPMINVHNRMATYDKLPGPGYAGGVLPVAPPNHLSMLHDYIQPSQRAVACPNQDVAYGQMVLALNREPVVIQVPDFGDRFWVYQIVDQRTDAFAEIGKMYGSKPGFYLLAGTDWKGAVPDGIVKVFRASTDLGMVIPRVFMDDSDADREAIQAVVNQIAAYPLSAFNGTMKTTEWKKAPHFPGDTGNAEVKWVKADVFAEQLPLILEEVPPLPGEEARYAQIRSVLAAAEKEPRLKKVLDEAAASAEVDLVEPLFEFRHYGLPLAHNWTTQNNGAMFGLDYYTRTAVAKSNILVNKPNETKYFYQDLDSSGARPNGTHSYTVTFAKGQVPPVRGFWSLTLYNEHHFFHPNELKRYSLGTKNKTLQFDADGSLTIYVGATPPDPAKRSNWLPAPSGDFSLYVRTYWPDARILEGTWTPPAVRRVS